MVTKKETDEAEELTNNLIKLIKEYTKKNGELNATGLKIT